MTPTFCPFCGCTKVQVVEGSSFRWCTAQCQDCGAQGPESRVQTLGDGTRDQWWLEAVERAIAEWNERAQGAK